MPGSSAQNCVGPTAAAMIGPTCSPCRTARRALTLLNRPRALLKTKAGMLYTLTTSATICGLAATCLYMSAGISWAM